jgi:hypothetical protein
VCRAPIGCRGWQCLSRAWGSKRSQRFDRRCLKHSRLNAAVLLCWVLPHHRLLRCSVVVRRRSPSSCNAEHRLLLPLLPSLSTPEPSATVSSSVVAGARAAGVAVGPSCDRAETPPFSTGEDPLSTLSSVCPRLSTLLRLRVAGTASFSAMVFMCTPVEWIGVEQKLAGSFSLLFFHFLCAASIGVLE